MENYIEVKAWRNNHSGVDFFVFLLNSEILMRISYVSAEEREKGVQRPLSEARCKNVAKFIDSKEGIFANNLILNLSEQSRFIPASHSSNEGILQIPDIEKTIWVIDGQHRLYGFQFSDKQFDLLCSGFIDLEIERQAQLFVTINQEQKGINPSVLYDLLPIIKDADFKKMRSQSLVKQLNEDSESAWFNEVKMLGVGKGLVSQAAFARNIETLIDPNGGTLSQYPEGLQYRILSNYFNAFKALFSKEWGSNKYVLTKAIGLAAMCGIFPKIHGLCQTDFTVENIIRQLSPLRDFDFSSITRGKSTNKVAVQQFILEILEELPKMPHTTEIKV
jgi:DGQHR domain-containing protein